MIGESLLHGVLQIGAGIAGVVDQALATDDLQVGDTGGGAQRMAGVGPAMADGAEFAGALLQHLPHAVTDDDPGQRLIGAGQALGDGDQVRLDAEVLEAELAADAPETTHYLIADHQDVVALEHGLDGLPVALRRRHDATGAQHRFADEGADGLRPFGLDHRLELLGAPGGEFTLAHLGALGGTAVVVRCLGVQDAGNRQIEVIMEGRQPGQRA